VELMVADTGIGIPSEELPLLGKRFHRVQTSGGRSHEGTGIGILPLSRRLRGMIPTSADF
jgi:signal transduction histidine kinase